MISIKNNKLLCLSCLILIVLCFCRCSLSNKTSAGDISQSPTKARLIIPQKFTPNGDGVTDTWDIVNTDTVAGAQIYLYTLYGQLVYSSKGKYTPWDGNFMGKPVSSGVYYYVIIRKNKAPKFSGWVTLER